MGNEMWEGRNWEIRIFIEDSHHPTDPGSGPNYYWGSNLEAIRKILEIDTYSSADLVVWEANSVLRPLHLCK